MSGLASVSVDVDSLPHYCRIHGIDAGILTATQRELVYGTALSRASAMFLGAGFCGTFFVIGEDLSAAHSTAAARELASDGHEIASHSHRHLYDLTRQDAQTMDAELALAESAVTACVGKPPVGFRAPGYAVNAALIQALQRRGYAYDASVFPAVPYYMAKGLVLGLMRVRGKKSASVMDRPSVLFAPRSPYHPSLDNPYAPGSARLLELPISVTPLLAIPCLGTLATLLPSSLFLHGLRQMRGQRHVNFELHAVDFLGSDDGLPAALQRVQRDFAVPWAQKRERLTRAFAWLAAHRETVTLAAAARQFTIRQPDGLEHAHA